MKTREEIEQEIKQYLSDGGVIERLEPGPDVIHEIEELKELEREIEDLRKQCNTNPNKLQVR